MLDRATTPAADADLRSEAAVALVVTCPCGNVLAVDRGEGWVWRHRGRVVALAAGADFLAVVRSARCEACTDDVPAASLDVHEYTPAVARVA